jgi:hypothetical protein
MLEFVGRSGEIRTPDPLLPNLVQREQTTNMGLTITLEYDRETLRKGLKSLINRFCKPNTTRFAQLQQNTVHGLQMLT